jgi:hypothetical protein
VTALDLRGAALVLAALAVAALSLLGPWALAFDPSAWLVWGRETGRLALDTSSGPSWKPLPVVFTTPMALAGDAAAVLWSIVARTGGLLALTGGWALAARLGGRWAGAAAAAVMVLSPWWLFNTALGNSEAMLAAALLWAVLAHLSGHPRAALALATAGALLRPEVWPFLGAYGVWLWRARPPDRRAVIVAGVLVPLLWFGPDLVGAGGALDASKTARGIPSPGSAKLADFPVLALLGDFATLLTVPALIAALLAVILGGRLARWIGAAAGAWIAIVAVMTVAGYAGNARYLVAAAAFGAVLAGAGAVRVAGAVGAAILVAAVLAVTAGTLTDQATEISDRADAAAAFDGVIAAAGGLEALQRCSRIRSSNPSRSFVAWRLDLPMRSLDATPVRPAVLIRAKWFYGGPLDPPRPPGYRTLVTTERWQVLAACGRAPQVEPES